MRARPSAACCPTRALKLASDGARALVLLGRGRQGPSALRSSDGGDSFEAFDLPVREAERVQDLQVARDVVLCCRRAPQPQILLWSAGEPGWVEVPGAEAPALLLDEGGVVRLYFCVAHAHAEGARLVRLAAFTDGKPEIVAEVPHEAGMPLQLAGGYRAGVTTLQLGSERAWYRVRVRGEDPRR